MRFLRFQNAVLALSLLAVAGFVAFGTVPAAYGQTATTGALSGSVTDGTGAVVPGATVVLVDTGTDATQTQKTNAEGHYTFANLKPGTYKVSATAESLKSDTNQVTVLVGTTAPGEIRVTPTGNKEVVEVSSTSAPLVDTENIALATTFAEQQIQDLPTPGGDVTTVAFTAPGVIVNAGTGSIGGNFSSNGLPGISNLFVLNGFDNQDPFLNLNNSGSSNLTLGQGELQEATVIQNAYNSQYGRAAGAEIQYTTKSGGNSFHGEADYNYNGTLLNANGWFNENEQVAQGQPNIAPHAVSNEWAVNTGGPIIKNKLFFFGDYEGLRYVLPSSSGFVTFPTPTLATYIEQTVPSAVSGLYAQAMNDYTKSPAYKSAITVTNGSASNQDGNGLLGCGDSDPADSFLGAPFTPGGLAGTPAPGGGFFGEVPSDSSSSGEDAMRGGPRLGLRRAHPLATGGNVVPCMLVGQASVNNVNKEWLFTGRADWYISDKNKIYGRYKMDRGSQPTNTSVIDPLFSALSIQPEYEGQFNDSYVISPTMTNVFVAASNWYSAYFGPPNVAASLAELPMNMLVPDDGLDGSGVNGAPGLGASNPGTQGLGVLYALTQGRNVTQYQIEDDFNWIKGKHAIKFGENFRRDLVSDYDSQIGTIFPDSIQLSLGDFASGAINGNPNSNQWDAAGVQANSYSQSFAAAPTAHLALFNIGGYVQDEIQASSRLKLTVGARFDRTGSPVCHGDCFANYTPGTFPASGVGFGTAYRAANGGSINSVENNAFPVEKLNFQPRGGFNFSIDDKTEIRGGLGVFSDLYPAAFLDNVIQNFPNEYAVNVLSGANGPTGAGSTGSFARQVNSTVQSAFLGGQGLAAIDNSLNAAGVPFQPPTLGAYFPGTFKVPEYFEYSLQLQRQISRSDALIVSYVGNYGYHEVFQNANLNASSGTFTENGTGGEWDSAGSFANLPSTPPDPRFSRVTAVTNNGHSNYNAGWISYKHNGHGVTTQFSYTYSHSLDLISNGGVNQGFQANSLFGQATPNLAVQNLNYASSDYDIRNSLTGDIVYEEPYKFSNKLLEGFAGGWILGAKTYYRGGEPFSIVNGAVLAGFKTIGGSLLSSGATVVMPDLAPGVTQHQLVNHSASDPHICVFQDCLDSDLDLATGNTAAQFVTYSAQTDFGNLQRNQERGPHYVDTDLSLLKRIVKVEGFTFELGANAYNVWNHANFAQPVNDISSGSFGQIQQAVAPPTSPYGSFQGAAVTQRLVQIHGKITF
jgi:hypothetical protein